MIINLNYLRLIKLIFLLLFVQRATSGDINNDLDMEFLTGAQLVSLVLERNPGHVALDAAVREARARILPAASLDDPRLSYSIAPLTVSGGSPERFRQSVELSQDIPWPGTLALQEQRAAGEADMMYYHLQDHELEMVMAIKVAFAEYAYLYHALQINRDNQVLLHELRQVAGTRYATGRSSQQEVLQTDIRHALLVDQAYTLEQGIASVRAQINALLNRAPQLPLPPPSTIQTVMLPQDSEALQAIAVENHPQLLRLQADIAVGKTEVGLAEKRFYPDMQLSVGYNNMWDNTDMRFMVGASVNLPFDRSKRRADRNAAEAGVLRARWQFIDQKNLLLAKLEQTRAEVIESVRMVELYEQRLLPLAENNLAAALADYQAGSGMFTNVINAETGKLETGLRLVRSRADYYRRNAVLERWTGRPLTTRHQERQP